MHLSGHTNMLMKVIKILWFWGVLSIFFRLRRPPYGGLRAKKYESLAGGWINFLMLYVYILLSFCYAMCVHVFIWHDMCTLTAATPIYLYFSLYVWIIHVSVGSHQCAYEVIKILWFWSVLSFFFSPAAGPLPGVALSGEQPPAARCAGAQGRKKLTNWGVNLGGRI